MRNYGSGFDSLRVHNFMPYLIDFQDMAYIFAQRFYAFAAQIVSLKSLQIQILHVPKIVLQKVSPESVDFR